MQVSKLFPVVGMAIMCLGVVSVRAQDTPAQAAARAALLQKLDEMNAGAPVNAATSAPPAAVAPVPAESPGATSAPPAMVTMPAAETPATTSAPPAAVTTPSGETPAQAAARAALMEKLSEMNNAESSNTGSSAPSVIVNTNEFGNVSAPAPAVMGASSTANGVTSPSSGMMTNQNMNMPMTPPPAEVTGAPVFLPVPPPSTGYDEAAGAALHQSQTNIAVTGAPVPSSSSPSVPNFSVSEQAQSNVDEITARELGLQPIQPPPPPVSAAQQEQLQELLQRYDANQITPEEYQAERAKIMAGQ